MLFGADDLYISSADIERFRTEFQTLAAFKTSPPEPSRGDNQMAQMVDRLNRERRYASMARRMFCPKAPNASWGLNR